MVLLPPDITSNVPVKLKLQHPPRAYLGHLTVHCAREGGNLNVALPGRGI